MASDIKNTADGVSGNQNLGRVTVATGGRGSAARLIQTLSPNGSSTIVIDDIDDKYDTRFDDPRYYQGDLVT